MAAFVAPPSAAPASPPSSLLACVDRVESALRKDALPTATRLGAMAAYHMGWVDSAGRPFNAAPGKMLRGGLCLWTCGALDGDTERTLPVAVALELIHNFTLIHDDIQDGDRQRRGRPAVWTLWGTAQAINAGDGLHALAHLALTAPGSRPARRLAAAQAVSRAVIDVIEGQCLDLALEGTCATTAATYLRLARAKTGALFGAAMQAGALLAGAGARDAALLRSAGRELGAAFQVRDDWLCCFGDPTITGKPRGSDLRRRKLTAVMVTAHGAADASRRRLMRRLFAARDEDSDERLLALVHDVGGSTLTSGLAGELAAAAVGTAAAVLPPAALEDFAELARFATERTR